MKKEFLIPCLFLLTIIIACQQKKANQSAVAPRTPITPCSATKPSPNSYALDGTKFSDLALKVGYFKGSKYDKGSRFCVWFPQPTMVSFCNYVNASSSYDGIRFYFVKDSQNAAVFNLIPVATTDGGPDSQYPDMEDHCDTYSATQLANTSIGQTNQTDPRGAVFYGANPCTGGVDNCPTPSSKHYIKCADVSFFVQNGSGDEIKATSEWFPKDLLSFLVTKNTSANGGIRFYFGKHTNTAPHDKEPRHGVIMMVTEPNAAGIQQDKFICIPDNEKFRKPWVDGGGANDGEECPNNCNGAALPSN